MLMVLGLMLLGLVVGRLVHWPVRGRRLLERLVTASILGLLFLLGASVGANDVLFSHLHDLGLEALILSVSAILGSLIPAWLLGRWLNARKLS